MALALARAAAAECAAAGVRSNTRARLAWLLCELGFQLGRSGSARDQPLPVGRLELAAALGTNLCRIKRTLALFSLSRVIEGDGPSLRVTDWHRLCAAAGYDPTRLKLNRPDFDTAATLDASRDEEGSNLLTRGGDQACFV